MKLPLQLRSALWSLHGVVGISRNKPARGQLSSSTNRFKISVNVCAVSAEVSVNWGWLKLFSRDSVTQQPSGPTLSGRSSAADRSPALIFAARGEGRHPRGRMGKRCCLGALLLAARTARP